MTVNVTGVDRYVIDGVTIWGRPTQWPPPAGLYLVENDGVVGWRGGVTVRAEDVPRTSADGSFSTPARLAARTSQWKAVALASDDTELGEWEDIVTGIAVNRFFPSTGQALGRTLSTRTRAAETPTFLRRKGRWGGMAVAGTEFQLIHPDPFLYGQQLDFPAATSLTLEVPGAAPAWPTITVRGTGAAYTITGGGATFTMSTPLPTGQLDVIETASMTVRRNGVTLRTGFAGTIAPAPRKRQPITYVSSAGALSATVQPRFL